MERKPSHSFGRRFLIGNLAYSIPCGLALLVAWTQRQHAAVMILSLAVFLLCFVSGIVLDVLRLRSFRCPQCGKRIAKPTQQERSEGDPINYACSDCKVEWVTGLREAGD